LEEPIALVSTVEKTEAEGLLQNVTWPQHKVVSFMYMLHVYMYFFLNTGIPTSLLHFASLNTV